MTKEGWGITRRITSGRNGKSVSDGYEKDMSMKNETKVGVRT